ncbi:MAG: copC [Bacilli bacterium]|nr:copC [Bacilli bacterium]
MLKQPRRWRVKFIKRFLLLALMLFLSHPSLLFAHASLLKSIPDANSHSTASPQQISLVFNERLENSLYYIKVINDKGQSVTTNKASMDETHTHLSLQLPILADGTYVTTYHIISADGHPVGGSYLFAVGSGQNDNTFLPPNQQLMQGHLLSWDMSLQDTLQSTSRIVYYFALLLLMGWVIWSALLRNNDISFQQTLRKWRTGLLRLFVIALIGLIYFHYQELLGDGGVNELLRLFSGTSIGISWLISFVLALLGFVILQRKRWLDIVWVLAMIATKCMNGHAIAFKPADVTLGLDAVHLFAAALWVGGLAIGFVFWKNKAFLGEWLPRFSRAALGSILVLTITGSITTLLFLPKLKYVLYTQWGTLLLIKVGLVVCVAIVGSIIRIYLRKWRVEQKEIRTLRLWLKLDLILMLLVVAIVGLLTYAAPIPVNQPFNWHEMGEKAHLTLTISPNIPGTNSFDLELWMPEKTGKPKQVEFLLKYKDDSSIAPIPVPLQLVEDANSDAGADSFEGFKRFVYKSEGSYLSFAGKWDLELNILDSTDEEIPFTNEMLLY